MDTPRNAPRVAIIGAGHNGLICACYLAEAGCDVTVLERRSVVGGMCVTEELFPGFKVSSVAGYYGMLRSEFVEHLELEALGLRPYLTDPVEIVFAPGGHWLFTPRGGQGAHQHLGEIAPSQTQGWAAFWHDMSAASRLIYPLYLSGAPTQASVKESLGQAGLHRIAETVFDGTLLELSSSYFTHPSLLAAVSTTSVGFPNHRGSVFSSLHLGTAKTAGQQGAWGMVQGGMGSVTSTLAAAAKKRGVKILTDTPVERILTDEAGRAIGVVTVTKSVQLFDFIVSNADPVTTLRQLVKPDAPGPGDLRHSPSGTGVSETNRAATILEQLQFKETNQVITSSDTGQPVFSVSAGKAHFVLRKLPSFPLVDHLEHGHKCSFVIAPSVQDVLDAAERVTRGYMPETLMLTFSFPSVTDPHAAPDGKHLCSADIHWLPSLCNGSPWNDTNRDIILEATLRSIEPVCPDLRDAIEDSRIISPGDLKDTYGLSSMHCWHAPMTSDFLMERRSLGGSGRYTTPITNLFVCGSGTFPGGNVTGVPGYNCAKELLASLDNSGAGIAATSIGRSHQ